MHVVRVEVSNGQNPGLNCSFLAMTYNGYIQCGFMKCLSEDIQPSFIVGSSSPRALSSHIHYGLPQYSNSYTPYCM